MKNSLTLVVLCALLTAVHVRAGEEAVVPDKEPPGAQAKPPAKRKQAVTPKKEALTPEQQKEEARLADARKRFEGIDEECLPTVLDLEEEYPKLIKSWIEVTGMYADLGRLAETFGTKARPRAQREVEKIEEDLPDERDEFREMYDDVIASIEKDRKGLRGRLARMESKRVDGRVNQSLDKAIAELKERTSAFGRQIDALDKLENKVTYGRRKVPDALALLGISTRDTMLKQAARDFPEITELRLSIKDHQADIADIEALKDKPEWSRTHEVALARGRAGLEKTSEKLKKEAEKTKAPMLKELEKAAKKIAVAEQKIESKRKRKQSIERDEDKLMELQSEKMTLELQLQSIDKLATWQEPGEKKEPAAGH